jgi:hypothetical protein
VEDDHRSGRRLSEFSGGIRGHLDKYPLTSIKRLAKHFSTFVPTISRMLTEHLALRKSSRREPPQHLTDVQKQFRCDISARLLNALRNNESAVFSQVTRTQESWFSCHYQSTCCYVKFCAAVPRRTKTTIAAKRALITICFTGPKLLDLNIIPPEKKFIRNHVLVIQIPDSSRGNTNARRRVGNNLPLVSMGGPMCHLHTKVRSISTERQPGEFVILFILRDSHHMTCGCSHA